MHVVDEHGQPEDTKYNRRDSCEVRNVYLDNVRDPVFRREFLKIDRRGHADRQCQHQYDQHHEQRANH